MNSNFNLLLAWLWILFGFISGMVLGLFFHGENWLGGYGSFKRRMYRLAHISFFGLGAVNLLFALTMQKFQSPEPLAAIASWAFIIGAITMPVCCVVMAHFPRANMIFAVPVVSLITGGVLMLMLVRAGEAHLPGDQLHASNQNTRPINEAGSESSGPPSKNSTVSSIRVNPCLSVVESLLQRGFISPGSTLSKIFDFS